MASSNNAIFADGKTVTVLFCDEENFLTIKSLVLRDLKVSERGRVIIPEDFRVGKTIFAVIEGEVKVLNTLGERLENSMVA
ncbi:TIGR02922 family protein (plasmid) [Shewanella xiamenensis]|uniref:TIGR02922 family protein n=1 Tax=Shewanella xiamenensis TaxID=332186 RepID=A0ABT6UDE0_9GAMM|nr:TIGR02922 family protein [Shewanella xiamenensis]MDI5832491.1 TIGR02922 family protein [Shewanella xiamenensis]WHF57890.1 TIGR02922 family protein [Shewanella xiamenensis]